MNYQNATQVYKSIMEHKSYCDGKVVYHRNTQILRSGFKCEKCCWSWLVKNNCFPWMTLQERALLKSILNIYDGFNGIIYKTLIEEKS